MASSNGTCEQAPSLIDLPAASLRNVVLCMWPNAKDVAALAASCKTFAAFCDDQLIWRELLVKRFGETTIPGMKPPPEQTRPVEVEGYVFYQGLDGSEESDKQYKDKDAQQLAELAAASGAEAFTTDGKVISVLRPQEHWKHTSFRPYQGMYVRQMVVQYRGLEEPAYTTDLADASWPPTVPGWLFFPSCVSPGHFRSEPADSLSRFRTIEALLHACSHKHNIMAVTTDGETKIKLRPQACWEVHPEYDVGLYVKTAVAQQMRLVPSPAVPDYRKLCAKLHKLRLDAAHMNCAWLNDIYMQLDSVDDSPADSGMALVLNHVWWLDVGGSIPGVPPGCYEVAWVVDVTQASMEQRTVFELLATARPVHGRVEQTPSAEGSAAESETVASSNAANNNNTTTASAGTEGGASATASDAQQPDGVQLNTVMRQASATDVQILQRQCRRQGAAWAVLSGGLLHVTDYSTVSLQFRSTDNTCKTTMRWAYTELIPVQADQQEQWGHRVLNAYASPHNVTELLRGWLGRVFGAGEEQ